MSEASICGGLPLLRIYSDTSVEVNVCFPLCTVACYDKDS